MKIYFILLFILTASIAYSGQPLKFLSKYPFKIGEKMVFTIKVLGVYVGDQEISLTELTTTNGLRVMVGAGHMTTTPFISSMYKIDDREKSYIIPENFIPIHYERWINEGNWHDHLKFNFFPNRREVEIFQKTVNYDRKVLSYKTTLRNYFTLISSMRSVDYEYHIANNLTVDIDYVYGTTVRTAKFKCSYKKYNLNGQKVDTIYLQEIGGIGMDFYLMNDDNRTPISLIIPAFEVIGFRTINVYVELKEMTLGSEEIPYINGESLSVTGPVGR